METGIKKVTLDSIGKGALGELFDLEMKNVAANIADPNTSATAKRSITITIEFAPDHSRDEAKVLCSVKSKLEPIKGVGSTVFTGKDNGKAALYVQDTKQINMFDQGVTPFNQNQAANNG